MASIVGREAELRKVDALLGSLVEHRAAGLVLWGEAGIGKSTIWQAGVSSARGRGFAVMTCRPAEAEQRLSYSGLSDLMIDVDPSVFDGLAVPQRRAMDAALLRDVGDAPPDQRAVAAALLSVVSACARMTPVLVAIDDVQWLDDPTRRAVGYAARRCRGAFGVLVTERATRLPRCPGWLGTTEAKELSMVRVDGLSMGALHHVVREEVGLSLTRPIMVRLAEVSAGNPFHAIEVARSVGEQPVDTSWSSISVEDVVRNKVARLEASAREALLVVSAVAEPSVGLLRQALDVGDATDLVAALEGSGLVELSGGRVRFTHPLWANAVYNGANRAHRRSLHRRLSALVDDVEERARHLALATTEPEDATVAALEEAADHARRRGAASAAAELIELAIALGAAAPARRIRAARDHFDADNPERARGLLASVLDDLGPGHQRAEALCLMGTIIYESDDFGRSVEILEQAFGEAGDDARLRCLIAMEISFALAHSGRLGEAAAYIATAVEEAETIGEDGLLAELLAVWVVLRVMGGEDVDTVRLERALQLEDVDRRSHALQWPSFNAAAIQAFRHDVEGARVAFSELYVRCEERGAESDLWLVLGLAIQVALWAGDVAAAQVFADEMSERARMAASNSIQALAAGTNGIVAAWRGDVDVARAVLPAALTALAPTQFATPALYALAALGAMELSVGDHEAAAAHLAPAIALLAAIGFDDPEVIPMGPDAAQAFIALGRLDEALPIVDVLERTGSHSGRDWARAVGARCRGLLFAEAGDLVGAADAYDRAVEAHRGIPLLRYEFARTLLVLGQLQRRRGDRRAAQSSFQQAAQMFEDSGAAQWATNARAELNRVGLFRGPADRLTASETRVAQLAAAGHTNREVAARLFVTSKTVEAHLARIYRKLGIHSRAELGRRMAPNLTDATGSTAV